MSSSRASAGDTAVTAAHALGVVAGIGVTALYYRVLGTKQYQAKISEKDALIESLLLHEEMEEGKSPAAAAKKCIYLDYNGTTPVYPSSVVRVMLPFFKTHYGNPGSSHAMGQVPKLAMNRAREQIWNHVLRPGLLDSKQQDVDVVDFDNKSIIFTSCGTETNNLAIYLALHSYGINTEGSAKAGGKPHIVASSIEHPAVSACLDHLVKCGVCDVTYVPVQSDGRVDVKDMIGAIRTDGKEVANGTKTALVTCMLANNETGVIQPIKQIAQHCAKHHILFHTDGAQGVGKIRMDVQNDLGNPDMITIVGHKMGAPKGIACLYVRSGCLQEHGRDIERNKPKGGVMLHGGGSQEFGFRSGTENVPYAVAMGEAAQLITENLESNAMHMETMRDRLYSKLQEHFGDGMLRVNGPEDPALRLPNTLSVGIKAINGKKMLDAIGDKVAASTGATCHSTGKDDVSPVVQAMKVPSEFAAGTIRLSVGPTTTVSDVDKAAVIIADEAKNQALKIAAEAADQKKRDNYL